MAISQTTTIRMQRNAAVALPKSVANCIRRPFLPAWPGQGSNSRSYSSSSSSCRRTGAVAQHSTAQEASQPKTSAVTAPSSLTQAAANQPPVGLFWAALQGAAAHPASVTLAAALLLCVLSTAPCNAAEAVQHGHGHSSLYDLAEGEEFWGNVAKYGRYFVTVMLGTGYVMVKPIVGAFKKPVTAIVAVVSIVGGSILLKFTLDAMLGIQEPFVYEPGSIVPYN